MPRFVRYTENSTNALAFYPSLYSWDLNQGNWYISSATHECIIWNRPESVLNKSCANFCWFPCNLCRHFIYIHSLPKWVVYVKHTTYSLQLKYIKSHIAFNMLYVCFRALAKNRMAIRVVSFPQGMKLIE